MELAKRLAGAWSYTKPYGCVVHRSILLATWVIIRIEEDLANVYYRRRGLDTGRPDMGLYSPGSSRIGYNPVKWRVLRSIFGSILIGRNDVLLDYGCGKGRVIIWAASRFPLARIIGVELDPQLHALAETNFRNWQGRRRCEDIAFIQGDATEFDVPDDVTIIFLYNPFLGDVFNKVIVKIVQSLMRQPRPLRVFYIHPRMNDALVGAGFSIERKNVRPPYEWAIYRYRHQSDVKS
jgi:SAM-dependent methyltransferase